MATITDLTGYTLVLNNGSFTYSESGDGKSSYTWNLNFISNNQSFVGLKEDFWDDDGLYYICSDGTKVDAFLGGWQNTAYKTMQITGGIDATNADLISWCETNGKLRMDITDIHEYLTNIADVIRTKKGTTDKINAQDFVSEIESIETEPILQTKTVTTNGTVTPDSGYDGLSSVTVNVPETIPDGYIIPSGSVDITDNGTHDITEYAEIYVDGIGKAIEVGDEQTLTDILNAEDGTNVGTVYKYTGETTDSYENGALYILEANLISFTIDGTSYQAESGMTWSEWCESDYNTGGFGAHGAWNGNISTSAKSEYYIYLNGTYMTFDDVIVEGTAYTTNYRSYSSGGAD